MCVCVCAILFECLFNLELILKLLFHFTQPVEVLMQGVQLHRDNMEEVVSMLKSKIQRLENEQQAGGERAVG